MTEPQSIVTNEDCMVLMSRYPDKYFDLAIVDPPYGIGVDRKNSQRVLQSKHSASLSKDYGKQNWDDAPPAGQYFEELFRVSENQIIWGANWFGLSGGMIYWNKNVTMPTYSDGEIAFCSMINSVKSFDFTWHGMIQENMKNKENRIHPTQKPIALYSWLLKNYAVPGQKILDTHLGSGSSRIACHKAGYDFVGCEIDKDYFEAQEKRFREYLNQLALDFTPAGLKTIE